MSWTADLVALRVFWRTPPQRTSGPARWVHHVIKRVRDPPGLPSGDYYFVALPGEDVEKRLEDLRLSGAYSLAPEDVGVDPEIVPAHGAAGGAGLQGPRPLEEIKTARLIFNPGDDHVDVAALPAPAIEDQVADPGPALVVPC